MARPAANSSWRILWPSLLPRMVAAVVLAFAALAAHAQQERGIVVQGYITAMHAPAGFEINGAQVITTPSTTYKLYGEKKGAIDSPLREQTQIGAYVWVEGTVDRHSKTATAHTIVVRDDWDQPLVGVGVIDKRMQPGTESVFRADGYLIRITPSTKCTFHGDLKTLSDVQVNTWLRYQARRGKDGVLEASSARFFTGRLKAVNRPADAKTVEMNFIAPNLSASKDGSVNLGALGKPHPIPAEAALQTRVMRVGADVVPAYQKALPDADPLKIDFRFYAIDNQPSCNNGCALHGGLILISRQSVERLASDGQLAAVLAESVVEELQHQAAGFFREGLRQFGATAAEDAGLIAITPLFIAPLEVEVSVERAELQRQEQRGRLALAMLDDAGYDPWQAPEAWRLLAPHQLPQDPGSLKYPSRSEYQLGILNLQYRGKEPAGSAAPAASASAY